MSKKKQESKEAEDAKSQPTTLAQLEQEMQNLSEVKTMESFELKSMDTIYLESDLPIGSSSCPTLRTTYSPQSLATIDSRLTIRPPSSNLDVGKHKKQKQMNREFSKISLLNLSDDALHHELSYSSSEEDYPIIPRSVPKTTATSDKRKSDYLGRKLPENTVLLDNLYDEIDLPITSKQLKRLCFFETLVISNDIAFKCNKNFNDFADSDHEDDNDPYPKKKQLLAKYNEVIGSLCLRIDNTSDHVITYCHSELSVRDQIAGHQILSTIDSGLEFQEETRSEWMFLGDQKIEKSTHIYAEDDKFIVMYEKTNGNSIVERRGEVSLRDYGCLIQDGGIYVMMRYLVLTKYEGILKFWSMDIYGEVFMSKLYCGKNRIIFINDIPYKTYRIKRENYLPNIKKPTVSKTYFLSSGHIVQHKWKGCPYYLHIDPSLRIPPTGYFNIDNNNLLTDLILNRKYEDERNTERNKIEEYLEDNIRIKNYLEDYLCCLLQLKPKNVLKFTVDYFQNLFKQD